MKSKNIKSNQSGKGSKRRPRLISRDEFDTNWETIFGSLRVIKKGQTKPIEEIINNVNKSK